MVFNRSILICGGAISILIASLVVNQPTAVPTSIPTLVGQQRDTYSVTRPIHETRTKNVHYTVMRPIYENRSRKLTYTAMNTVREQKTLVNLETGEERKYCVMIIVPEQKEKIVNSTVCKMVPEQKTKTVEYRTTRMVTVEMPRH